jgi:mannosyltransferase
MKLHIDGIIFSLQKHGGISVYFRELLNYINIHGVDIEANVSLELPYLQDILGLSSEIMIERRPARFLERYRDCRLSKNTKVFHSSYYRRPKYKGIASVVTVHDFIYERYSSGIARTVHMTQKHAAIRQAQAIICVSNSTYEDLFELVGIRADQTVHVIHNGVNPIFRPLEKISTEKCQPFVLYVGERRGYKNFNLVVSALKHLPEFELHCVGGGPFRKEEFQGIDPSVCKRVKHLGYLSDEELNLAHNDSLCLLYPSQYEGFGIPVIQAMRAGCPVVSINCKAIIEVGGQALELVQSEDQMEIAHAVLKLLDDSYRNKKVLAGIQQSKQFDWAKCHAATLDLYRNLN